MKSACVGVLSITDKNKFIIFRAPGWIRTHNPTKRAAADVRLRPGVHAPIKSVSVPAPISVVLVFHVTL